MDSQQLRAYCLSKKEAVETFPFGEDVRVFKVMGKVFALVRVSASASISLKCEPTWAQILRQTYPAVKPGWHLNKEHWNSIQCDGSIPDEEILGMIDHSYELIVKSLPKKVRQTLEKYRPEQWNTACLSSFTHILCCHSPRPIYLPHLPFTFNHS